MQKERNSYTCRIVAKMSVVMLLLLASCNKDEVKLDELRTDYYLVKYMNYPSNVSPEEYDYIKANYINWDTDYLSNDSIPVEYINNRISKRSGHLIQQIAGYGFPTQFVKDIYDTLIYSTNQVTILTKSRSKFIVGVDAFKKDIFYENGRISKTIQYFQSTERNDITVNYSYTNGLLTRKTGYRGTYLYFQSDFYYNAIGNLDSVIRRSSYYNDQTGQLEIDSHSNARIKEVFENYDNSKNPMKPFIIFDETFNRSLSENNYRKYSYYDFEGYEWHYNYNLKYDNDIVNFAAK